jgi:UDP-GlcNAc:undecaprenyl-phosphate GlcNAc-1-phosphate transferase
MIVATVGGFCVSALGTYVVRRVASRRGFVDRPGEHKRHETPVILGGGVAIAAGIVGPLVVAVGAVAILCPGGTIPEWMPPSLAQHIPGLLSKLRPALALAGGAVVLHVLGLIDDRRNLGPGIKLAVQVGVAVVLATVFDLRLMTRLGPGLSIGLTIIWIVIITNAFNLLDNMDGLCAGVAAIVATVFALSGILSGQLFVPTLAFLVVGVMLGFLWHNFPPARIYMGDAGSLVIGYMLAVLAILTTYLRPDSQDQPFAALMPLVVFAVPLYDTCSVVLIRLRRGISPFRGDQRHFSHRLVERGLSPRGAVLTIYLATVATSIGAALLPDASWTEAALIALQCACVVGIIAILEATDRPTTNRPRRDS